MKKIKSSYIIIQLLVLTCSVSCYEDQVTLAVDQIKDQDGSVGGLDDHRTAFETIADVNPETANMMPDNFDRQSNGLFEYDVMLDDWTHEKVFGPDPNRFYGASGNFKRLWPNGIVYYTYDSSIAGESSGKTLSTIEKAIKVFHTKTCIKFVKRTSEEHYIEFHKGSGCWSLIGRTGGKQQISLGYGCEQVGVAIHEMCHALGFWHEQSRPDRDNYVTILFDNVKEGMKDQFKKYDREIDSMGSPYDYKSVMHYGDTSFSKDPRTLKTILVKDRSYQGTIGQREGLSTLDTEQLNKLYKCSGGSSVSVDGNWGSWSSWSACDRTCGGGNEIRSRTCDSPSPSNGGKTCSGSSIETRRCNTASCPVPIECDFDSSFCLWKNLANEEFDWQRIRGPTTSGDTGPNGDHTSGTGSYIYIETSSPRQQNDRAVLQSTLLSGVTYSRCFKFYYHMYGVNINGLYVYLQYGNVLKSTWKLQGNQGNKWFEANLPIDPSQSDVQILIMGARGNGYQGDIALDDFSIDASYCSIKPINARVDDVKPTTKSTTKTTTTTTTTKKTLVNKYATFFCDFESTSTQCQWQNINGQDTMDWQVNTGSTRSGGTGPSTGTYAYLEGSSPAIKDDSAWLISPILSLTSTTPRCFKFQYHMYGDGIGELNIMFYDPQAKTLSKYWILKGNQGNSWQDGEIQIPSKSQLNIIIEAVRGHTFTSDIAIDNLKVVDGQCVLKPASAQVQTTKPTTTTTTTTDRNDKAIKIEVVSEGCGDPTVRQKTLAKQAQPISRKRRSLQGWKDFFKRVGKAGKDIIKKVKEKIEKDENGTYKKFIDHVNKRVVSYLQKKYNEKMKTTSIDSNTGRDVVAIQNDCSLAKSSILVNGVEAAIGKPGHNVVVIDGKTGTVIFQKWYDTKSNSLATTTAGSDLLKVPDDSIIVIATQDSVLPQFIGETELQKIGAVPPYLPGPKGSWAFIGYKGQRKVDWIKQVSNTAGNGPSRITLSIPLMTGPVTNPKTTPSTSQTITTITIVKEEVHLQQSNFMKIPLVWSNKIDLGQSDYTISLWFQTSQDGSLFSKVHPSLTTYSDDIKTVYIEGGYLNVKLGPGLPYKVLKKVTDGLWHHMVLTVKQASPSDIIKIYVDNTLVLSKLFQSTADPLDTTVNIGKTVDKYPGKTLFNGRLKKFIYKTIAVKEDEIRNLFQNGKK